MIWYVAVGSAAGGMLRYLLTGLGQRQAGASFPLGTLVVNITGSLFAGFLLSYALARSSIRPEIRVLLTTGFCGGYTTFSAFSYETAMLIGDSQYSRAALYVALSVTLALVATFAGMAAAQALLVFRGRV
ncbi:MAG: fluoride efflux transporter CrcB [Gemmatimonadaceae bacterium]